MVLICSYHLMAMKQAMQQIQIVWLELNHASRMCVARWLRNSQLSIQQLIDEVAASTRADRTQLSNNSKCMCPYFYNRFNLSLLGTKSDRFKLAEVMISSWVPSSLSASWWDLTTMHKIKFKHNFRIRMEEQAQQDCNRLNTIKSIRI